MEPEQFATSTAGPVAYDYLTKEQQKVVAHVLIRVYELSDQEARKEADSRDYVRDQAVRRPRHVFHIDGQRGSGKTTVLLTIREHLKFLGIRDIVAPAHSNLQPTIEDAFNTIVGKGPDDGTIAENLKKSNLLRARHRAGKAGSQSLRRTALVLPVLFPSDLADAQPVMEGLFALIDDMLEDKIESLKSSSRTDPHAEAGMKVFNALSERLRGKVAKSWFISKDGDAEAILRSSHDYDRYLNKRGKSSGQSYRRVGQWRKFVNDLLDCLETQSLVVFFDDTDVTPNVSADILHTMRIFLDHPRIVTIIAANVRTMRQSLLWREMEGIRKSMGALSSPESATAGEWRRFLRQQLEEYIEKVIPRAQRFFLTMNDPPPAIVDPKAEEVDIQKWFDEYCEKRVQGSLQAFFRKKLETHTRWIRRLGEIQKAGDREELEQLLSWWLLRHWYSKQLRPNTVRELQTLLAFTRPDEKSKTSTIQRDPQWYKKRLAVILFERADNFTLIHRFSDQDTHVHAWLKQQETTSGWDGTRYFKINDRKLVEGTYSYDYLRYRLDLGLSTPLRENPEADIPKGLLPKPAGRNLSDRAPFWAQHWTPHRAGLAAAINHSLIPANCINFYDVECLPDVVWHSGPRDEPWRPDLIYRWSEVFDMLGPRLTDAKDQRRQSETERYFLQVVLPFATLDIGKYVSSPLPTFHETGGPPPPLLLSAEIGSKGFFNEERIEADLIRRNADYISMLSETALHAEGTAEIYKDVIAPPLKALIKNTLQYGEGKFDKVRAHWVSYQWLLNDVRRAWHAARIFVNQMGEAIEHADEQPSSTGQGQAQERILRRFFSRRDRYRIQSLVSFEHARMQSQSFEAFWGRATKPIENLKFAKRVGGAPRGSSDVVWDNVGVKDFIRAVCGEDAWKAAEKETDGGKMQEVLRKDVEAGLLTDVRLDDGANGNGLFLFGMRGKDLKDARLARALFFFVVGAGPCLPALIHIEIAGALMPGPDAKSISDDAYKKARKIGEEWQKELEELQDFILRYRATLERSLMRVEVIDSELRTRDQNPPTSLLKYKQVESFNKIVDKGPSPGTAVPGVERELIPDGAFSSLGLEGRAGLRVKDKQEKFLSGNPLEELLLGPEEKVNGIPPRAGYTSLFRDAESHLNRAQKFRVFRKSCG